MPTFDVYQTTPLTLKPYYRNNKLHDKQQVALLAKVIKKFGFDQPIVVDKDDVIIKGHGRWLAALSLNLTTVPVVKREDLTPWQVQASRIADNKSFSLSTIDEELSRAEVLDFVAQGGVGASLFFDFQSNGEVASDPAAASGGTTVAAPNIAGALVTCPKCSHVQMEA